MIQIEISVDPHYRDTTYDTSSIPWVLTGPPPHVIISRDFQTWDETKKFIETILDPSQFEPGFESVWNNPNNEYVQVEISLLERTGTVYTKASLSIEGREE
jgi:hypothetical protein